MTARTAVAFAALAARDRVAGPGLAAGSCGVMTARWAPAAAGRGARGGGSGCGVAGVSELRHFGTVQRGSTGIRQGVFQAGGGCQNRSGTHRCGFPSRTCET